jgi:hypothetical protein
MFNKLPRCKHPVLPKSRADNLDSRGQPALDARWHGQPRQAQHGRAQQGGLGQQNLGGAFRRRQVVINRELALPGVGSDAVGLMPAPLLAQPEGHGLVELSLRSLRPPSVELVQLSPAEVPLSPAAAYLARCLADAVLSGKPKA